MDLRLNGDNIATYIEQGRWKSITFLTYIHNHMFHLPESNSLIMSSPLQLFNLISV
jgi:hypothetical protein